MSVKKRMDKQMVVQPCNEILLSNTKEQTINMHMDEPQKH